MVNLEVFISDRFAFDHARAPPAVQEVRYYHVPDFEPVHLINWSLLDTHVAHFIAIVKRAQKSTCIAWMGSTTPASSSPRTGYWSRMLSLRPP